MLCFGRHDMLQEYIFFKKMHYPRPGWPGGARDGDYRSMAPPASTHALNPPPMWETRSSPIFCSVCAASADLPPAIHIITNSLSSPNTGL